MVSTKRFLVEIQWRIAIQILTPYTTISYHDNKIKLPYILIWNNIFDYYIIPANKMITKENYYLHNKMHCLNCVVSTCDDSSRITFISRIVPFDRFPAFIKASSWSNRARLSSVCSLSVSLPFHAILSHRPSLLCPILMYLFSMWVNLGMPVFSVIFYETITFTLFSAVVC